MLLWLLSLVFVAIAGTPAELAIERGRAAMLREAFDEARDQALVALTEAPRNAEAQQLYIDATSAAGFGSRALQDLSSQPADPPPGWRTLERELRASLAEQDDKRFRQVFKRLLEEHPEHPEALAVVWSVETLRGRLQRYRVRNRHLSVKARSNADVVGLFRMRELARAADRPEWLIPIDERLTELGETPIPARDPLDRIGRTRYAERLVAEPSLALAGYPTELVDVADRAARLLFQGARYERAAELYQQVQRLTGAPEAWAGEAEAWRLADQLDRARETADAAIAHATDPRPSDLSADNAELQRATLARAFFVSAKVYEDADDPGRAQNHLAIAHLLSRRVLDDRMTERIREARRSLDVALQARYRGRQDPVRVALDAADTTRDPDEVSAHVGDAMLLLSVGTRGSLRIARSPDAYEDLFALPAILLARAAQARGDVRLARSYAMLATLLAGEPDPFWFAERAALQQTLEETDAAFVSWAKARGLGVPDLDGPLSETWIGLGDWVVAAEHAGGVPPAENSVDPATEAAGDPSSDVVQTTPLPRNASVPRLGQPMPSFVIPTRAGRLDSSFLRGRIVVLSFFDTECDACLQMLPQFGTLARRLRQRGLDSVVIAVSVDEDPAEFERMAHVGGHWGEAVHEPELARRFGVDRLPTTYLVDASGTVRFYIDHWISGDELLDYIDQIK
ncbi:MAG: TlpA disulfide reductase family protein [Myxococcota bacterium]